jgi:hypothetical protein
MSRFAFEQTYRLMSKDKYFIGNPVFAQIIKLLPFAKIRSIAKKHQSDKYTKKCDTLNHLITMLYGVISGCNSLREVCEGIVSYGNKINHCHLEYAIPKSTLADANKRRTPEVFEEIYEEVLKNVSPFLSDSGHKVDKDLKLYAIDSTTISLFQSIFECVGRNPQEGKRKGGVKSHQKLDINTGLPVKIWHSDATKHDSVFIHMEGVMQSEEIAVMDKAYNNYKAFAQWNDGGVYFVTRLKENAKETLVRELNLSDSDPDEVLRDAIISLKYDTQEAEKQIELRLVSYYDSKKNRTFYFLTNILDLKAIEICDIYRKRWVIELFFKKIKQNFPMTYFYGDNKNAIQIQIWCVLIACVLLTYIQKTLKKKWSFSNLVSILQKHLFSYVKLVEFLENIENYAREYMKIRNKNDVHQAELQFSG